MHKKIFFSALILFLALTAGAVIALSRLDQSVPLTEEEIPSFTRPEFSSDDLRGEMILVNFFASWCPPCEAEHAQLIGLKSDHGLKIYGVNYKDSDGGRRDYLQRLGNPYAAVTSDPRGELAALFNVGGVPETLVIDRKGIIRHRMREPLTAENVKTTLIPLIRRIR